MWEKNTHVVVIIGYGTDEQKKEKYWIVRNSYGTSSGDKGDLKIRRGRNDNVIETSIAAFDPVLCSEA